MATAPSTLYDYYTSKGQTLKSYDQRFTDSGFSGAAAAAGISQSAYTGTTDQNNAILAKLLAQDSAASSVGTSFSGAAPAGLTPEQTAAYNGVQQAFQPAIVPPVPATINSANTSPVTPTPYTTPTPTPSYPVATLPVPAAPAAPAPTVPATLTDTQQQGQDITKQIMDLNLLLTGKSADQTAADTQYGVPDAQKAVTDLGTQLQGLKNEAAAIPLQLMQGASTRGVTNPILGRQENSRLRTNAIAALGVSTLMNAAQGNLSTAQAMADKAVAAKYDPIEAQITAATKNLQLIMNSPQATLEEKNQAQAQLDQQKAKQDAVDLAKTNATQAYNIAISSAANSTSFTPTSQYPSLAVALQAISNSPDAGTALGIAASVGLTGKAAAAAADGTKILGSASTGYFSYDPATGKTTPVSAPAGGGSGTGGSGGSDGGGTVTISSAQKSSLVAALNASKYAGAEADGQYADPNLYLANYNSFIQAGGDPSAFFAAFPPKTYINPANTFLPAEIMKYVR